LVPQDLQVPPQDPRDLWELPVKQVLPVTQVQEKQVQQEKLVLRVPQDLQEKLELLEHLAIPGLQEIRDLRARLGSQARLVIQVQLEKRELVVRLVFPGRQAPLDPLA